VAAHKCFRQAANTQHTFQVCELLYSSFQTYVNSHFNSNVLIFLIAHFNTIVSTFRDWMTNQAGKTVAPTPLLLCKITVSSNKLSLLVLRLNAFRSREWHTHTLLQLMSVLYAFQKHMHFGQNKVSYFLFLLRWFLYF